MIINCSEIVALQRVEVVLTNCFKQFRIVDSYRARRPVGNIRRHPRGSLLTLQCLRLERRRQQHRRRTQGKPGDVRAEDPRRALSAAAADRTAAVSAPEPADELLSAGSAGIRTPAGTCARARTPAGTCARARTPAGTCASARTPAGTYACARTPAGTCARARARTPAGTCASTPAGTYACARTSARTRTAGSGGDPLPALREASESRSKILPLLREAHRLRTTTYILRGCDTQPRYHFQELKHDRDNSKQKRRRTAR